MDISKMSNTQLVEIKLALEHARDNRPGGLLYGEQKALEDITTELNRRDADKKEISTD